MLLIPPTSVGAVVETTKKIRRPLLEIQKSGALKRPFRGERPFILPSFPVYRFVEQKKGDCAEKDADDRHGHAFAYTALLKLPVYVS